MKSSQFFKILFGELEAFGLSIDAQTKPELTFQMEYLLTPVFTIPMHEAIKPSTKVLDG